MTRAASVILSLAAPLLAALGPSCQGEGEGAVPFGEAPFAGPAIRVIEPSESPGVIAAPEPDPQPALIAADPIAAATPIVEDEASRREAAWLNEPFRCKAISTTKLRGCRFDGGEGGRRLRFQMADVVCEDVEFDASGDPARLTGCKAAWLVMPREVELHKARGQDVWSGSHGGWRWKDGERYCCPGLWLEAPASLRK